MSNIKKRTFKIHVSELVSAMVFLGGKVTSSDVANHFYQENWGDADKFELLEAVQATFAREMKTQSGKKPEDHYGIRKAEGLDLYWLNYKV